MRRISRNIGSVLIGKFITALSILLIIGCNQKESAPSHATTPATLNIHGHEIQPGLFPVPESIEITQTISIPAGKPLKIPAKKLHQDIQRKIIRNGYTIADTSTHVPGKDNDALPIVKTALIDTVLARLPKTVRIEGMTSNDINPACITRFGKLQGLDAYNVMSALQDSRGNIWLAIWNGGVTRYDGHYFYTYTKTEGLKDDKVLALHEDGQGNIWIGYFDQGISKFDGSFFTHYSAGSGIAENSVKCIAEDAAGNLWLGSYEGGITLFDGHQFNHFNHLQGFTDYSVTSIVPDQGDLWIGTKGDGLFRYRDHGFTPVSSPFLNDTINALQYHNDHLWVGTEHGILKLSGHDVEIFPGSIVSRTSIQSIAEDDRGNVWAGSFQDGVFRLSGNQLYQYTEEDGLGNRAVHALLNDQSGNVWFGTTAGFELFNGELFSNWTTHEGLLQNNVLAIVQGKTMRWFGSEDGFTGYDGQYFYQYSSATGLPNSIIFTMLEDHNGAIWLGTNIGLVLFTGTEYIRFPQLGEAPVLNLFEDHTGDIWLSGYGAVRVRFGNKQQKNEFTFFGEEQGLSNNAVKCVAEDSFGNYWIGTDHGLNRLVIGKDDHPHFFQYLYEQGITNAYITSLLVDHANRLWIGTFGGGLLRYASDPKTNQETIISFREKDGLISDWVSSIMADEQNNLWVGGRHGICKISFTPAEETSSENIHFRNYQYSNGFLGGSSNMRAICKDTDGTLWVGTKTMAITINTTSEKIEAQSPVIEISNVQLFGENIHWRQLFTRTDQNIVLENGIRLDKDYVSGVSKWRNVPEQLSLKHDHNDLTIGFTNVTTLQNDQILYQHKLTGLDPHWSSWSPTQEVHFGPIPPGHYTFQLRAVNAEGLLSPEIQFPFIIRPPWWRTWWAYLIYFICTLSIANSFRRYELKRQQLQHSLQLEAIKNQNLEELDLLKTKLYTNITHEFRTPLTVILGISDQIRNQLETSLRDKLELIHRNGWQLLNLVNQMLDLAKIESNQMGLQLIQGNIMSYLKYLLKSFESLAGSKGIELSFTGESEEVMMDYDPGRILQVISNLIINAVKFTPQGGRINLSASKIEPSGNRHMNPELKIEVSDSGIGIPADQLPFIFNRFYQSDNAKTIKGEGTGIGLTLTRELIHLMQGNISVTSAQGAGTKFLIHLPITHSAPLAPEADTKSNQTDPRLAYSSEYETDRPRVPDTASDKPLLLIVEDNEDIRTYLISCLAPLFDIEIATDGAAGIETAMRIIPDIVITDVMMPVKDGFEVTETLKTTMATSHIPIVILTAKATAEDRIAGLKRGADVYLAKPFYQEELQLHVQNLIKLREKLQARYLSLQAPLTRQHTDAQLEDAFILKLRNLVEDNLENSEFSIEDLCKQMAMSRMQMHRKIKALTNLSTSIYIRNIRLSKARELLETTNWNVSEVAYAVGFEDPRYFSRVFNEYYGHPPSDLK